MLARLLLVLALLAGSQASLAHSIEHGIEHESEPLCEVLDALGACAPPAAALHVVPAPLYLAPIHPAERTRPADAPPFLAHGPPAAAV